MRRHINCAEAYGIVNGTSATTYDPGGFLTRAQAASMLVQFAETSLGAALVPDGVDDFPDDNGTTHEANIEKAVDNGLLQGFGDGTFGPGVLINRGQFATIAVNTVEFVLGSALVGDGVDGFDDDNGTTHESNIEKAADNGLLVGTGTRMFSPGANVSRGQTASILIQAAGNVLFPAGAFAPAVATNQTFAVTPAQEATNVISTSGVDDTGRRTYSADVTGTTVDIALFPAENVTDTNGVISFADVVAPANQADWTATNAVIELVNGSIAGTNPGYLDNVVVPGSGTVTFAIDSQLADEVIPVLFTNAASGTPVLALDAADEPTVAFGIGGQTSWVPAEAGAGAFPTAAVEQVSRSADFFVADTGGTSDGPDAQDLTFNYDANDVFKFSGTTISMSQFEGLLTGDPVGTGDQVAVFYDPNPANISTFNVTTDNVASASNVAATAADFDADGAPDDVRITWTASSQPDAVYDVYQSTNTACTAGAPDILVEGNSTDTTFTDLNVPPTTTTYCVWAKGATSGSLAASAQVDNVVTPPVADTTGAHVVAEGAAVDTDAGTTGTADTGDVFMLLFDEPVTSAPGATLAVTGTSGGSTNVQNSVNATFANVDATTVSITLTQPLVGTGALTFPLTLTAAAGFPDTAGNATIFGNWLDFQLETGGPEFATDTSFPFTGAQSRVVSATQIVLVFNEAVAPLSVQANCSNFTITSGGTCASASASGRTVTLTGSGFIAGTTMVAIVATVTDTEGESTAAQGATVIPAA